MHVATQDITGGRGLDFEGVEEAGEQVQSQVNKASLAVPGVWVTLVCITTAAAREQKRSGPGNAGGQENPKKVAELQFQGPVIIESGRVVVESSRAESRQVEDEEGRKQAKQAASKQA